MASNQALNVVMSISWPANDPQEQKRPQHVSIASYSTSASTHAESAISATSGWTGEMSAQEQLFAQFPVPPSELRIAPVRSDLDSPSRTPTRADFDGGSSPATPRGTHFPRLPLVSDSQGRWTDIPTTAPLFHGKRGSPSPSSSRTGSPAASGSSFKPRSGTFPDPSSEPRRYQPPLYPTIPEERSNYPNSEPPSLASLGASVSVYDSHDAASIVSVNPSEEHLLSTSFIASLLSPNGQSSGIFPPSAWSQRARPGGERDDFISITPSGEILRHLGDHDPHNPSENEGSSRPTHQRSQSEITYPPASMLSSLSELSSPANFEPSTHHIPFPSPALSHATALDPLSKSDHGENSEGRTTPSSSRESIAESLTLATDDGQVQSVVRSASLTWGKGSSEAKVVGVAPAYTIQSLASWRPSAGTNNGVSTSALKPAPLHLADAPYSVSGHTDTSHGRFTNEGTTWEPDDFHKGAGLDGEQLLNIPLSPALPSTAGIHSQFGDAPPSRGSRRTRRKSAHSAKSTVSSLVSRISRSSSVSNLKQLSPLAWRRRKPLPPRPPVPHLPPSNPHEDGRIRKLEDQIPLPQLAQRADMLVHILDKGDHGVERRRGASLAIYTSDSDPHRGSLYVGQPGEHDSRHLQVPRGRWSGWRGGHHNSSTRFSQLDSPNAKTKGLVPRKRKKAALSVCILTLIIILVVGITVGLEVRKSHQNSQPQCTGNLTGLSCDLDATCVCTSSVPGQCNQLAQSLLSLIPTVNSLFIANFTPISMSNAVWETQGTPMGGLCAEQALLVDVAPGLDKSTSPNRTLWAQSAILWNLAVSADLEATVTLREFVAGAKWSSLHSTDGPVPNASVAFTSNANLTGYEFNFASQTIVPLNISFADNSQISSTQLAQVTASGAAGAVLDRMYSFATASSTQRQMALSVFWQTVLQQQSDDLSTFMSAVRSAPFLLPFDATASPGGQQISSLLTNSTTVPFPPPIACYPSLTSSQLQRLNTFETTVFDLPPATAPMQFDTSCFADRPIYGVVDLLRLRLPFIDSRTGVAKQAAALSPDVLPRVVLYSGEVLSALPGASDSPDLTAATTDPREFGTSGHMNHVLLNYLSSIPDVHLAMALVQFVLNGNATPPSNTSALFNNLSSIPVLEFAVFGSVTPSDIASSVSAFSTPSGALFFGSDQGQAFRTWALTQSSSSVVWTELATSAEVVRESSAFDNIFESVWTPASELVHMGSTGPSDVGRVVTSLQAVDKFSP